MNLDPTEIVLFEWFDILPMGIEVCPGVDPPKAAWDALVYYLATKSDKLAWRIGATCNKYPKKYHTDLYIEFSSLTGLSSWTIQQYAYVERHIPYEARVGGLSIWLHRPVAKVEYSGVQQNYLEACKEKGWNVGEFETFLKSQGEQVEEHHYQSDKKFEDDKRQYDMANDLADAKRQLEETRAELDEAKSKLESTPKPAAESPILPPPSPGPDLTDLDWNGILQVKDTLIDYGYSSVTVHSNGDVTWHR